MLAASVSGRNYWFIVSREESDTFFFYRSLRYESELQPGPPRLLPRRRGEAEVIGITHAQLAGLKGPEGARGWQENHPRSQANGCAISSSCWKKQVTYAHAARRLSCNPENVKTSHGLLCVNVTFWTESSRVLRSVAVKIQTRCIYFLKTDESGIFMIGWLWFIKMNYLNCLKQITSSSILNANMPHVWSCNMTKTC